MRAMVAHLFENWAPFITGTLTGNIVGMVLVVQFGNVKIDGSVASLAGAVVAAGVTTFGAMWVVRHQEGSRRARRHFAARAAMPAALSELVAYAKAQITLLKSQRDRAEPNVVVAPRDWTSKLPAIPTGALSTLQTCIETAESSAMQQLAQIFEDLQVMHSRLADLLRKPPPNTINYVDLPYLESLLIEALEFHIRCSLMFDYARRKTTDLSVAITSADMCSRAFFEDLHKDQYPDLVATIQRLYPAKAG